jgi:hypothetical protein
MKRFFLFVVIFAMAGDVVGATYGGGSGKPGDPFQIWTAEHMNTIGTDPNDWDRHFILMADIDLSIYSSQDPNEQYNIIGTEPDLDFIGSFDGNGHTISNFTYVSALRSAVGLFGYFGGQMKDLTVTDAFIDSGPMAYIAVIAGMSCGTITNCRVTGTICGGNSTAGLVGWNYGEIVDCHTDVIIAGGAAVSGLVAWNFDKITDCSSTGYIEGAWNDIGGLVGINWGYISCSYSTASCSGPFYVGGLVGNNGGFCTIVNCYSCGWIAGDRGIGGLVGRNLGTISNCYSTGHTSGNSLVGGIIGYNWTQDEFFGDVTSSLWDIETSGVTNMCGAQDDGALGCDDSCGKTTDEMQTAETFILAGWDFLNLWYIKEGFDYPNLIEMAIPGDFEPDGDVDIDDFFILSDAWLTTPADANDWNPACNLCWPTDSVIDVKDFKVFTENWLQGVQ